VINDPNTSCTRFSPHCPAFCYAILRLETRTESGYEPELQVTVHEYNYVRDEDRKIGANVRAYKGFSDVSDSDQHYKLTVRHFYKLVMLLQTVPIVSCELPKYS
jgi:hypothetical protein